MKREGFEKITNTLEKSISEKMESAGLCCRIFSRTKTQQSLDNKMKRVDKNYGFESGQKLLQDMIGIRIVLYYVEDIDICKNMLTRTYQMDDEWESYSTEVKEFKAQKTNGVFRIPQTYVKNEEFLEFRGEYPIDKTFEVQIRTFLFEGWHEVEHDVIYKEASVNQSDFWEQNRKLNRRMSSVLATLELCDYTIHDIFDGVAAKALIGQNWDLALRSHFRFHFSDEGLNRNTREYLSSHEGLTRRIFELDKADMIGTLINDRGRKKLTLNRFLWLMCTSGVITSEHDEEDEQVQGLIERLDREENQERRSNNFSRQMSRLKSDYAFYQSVKIAHGNIAVAAQIIYSWARYHVEHIYADLPKMIQTGRILRSEAIGHKLDIYYDLKDGKFHMDLQHISSEETGLIWHTVADIRSTSDETLFTVHNICEAVNSRIRDYSRPRFAKDIYKEIGFIDGETIIGGRDREISSNIDGVEVFTYKQLMKHLEHRDRSLPIIALLPMCNEPYKVGYDGYTIDIETLQRHLAGICHVVKMDEESVAFIRKKYSNKYISDIYDISDSSIYDDTDVDFHGSVMYWPMGASKPMIYLENDIRKTRFEELMYRIKEGEYEYNLAFRKLLRHKVCREYTKFR